MTEPPEGLAGRTTVRVSVTLKGILADRVPGGRTEAEVAVGAAVETLIHLLDLPRSSYIFVINGTPAVRGAPLQDGDRVQVHPPMAGG